MNHFVTRIFLLGLMLFIPVVAFTQDDPEVGDFRTNNSGNWSNAQIWHRWNGSAWAPWGTPPTGSETITVLTGDSVFVNVEITVDGKLVNQGRVYVETDGFLTIADGGVYQHDRNEGNIPLTAWGEGSTFLLTGTTATAPADRNQNYYNIIFNTPGLLANLNMDLSGATIGGDITVLATGFGRWYLTTALAQDTSIVTINGDVIVEDGAFSVQGTSNALTTFIVHHYGNVTVTGGNFSISRGSQGGGTTTWYLHEGDFTMSNATTQNSTATVSGAKFVFMKDGVQTLTLGDGNTLSGLPIEVASGTTLQMGESVLSGSGTFDLNSGAILGTALAGGLESIFANVVGTVTLEPGSGFEFNGTDAQVTSARMPETVGDLIINNPAGVALSQETLIEGVLRLQAGVFDNTVPFELGPNGSISEEGGSLLHPYTSVEEIDNDVPQTFFVDQNYPNPFNPTTTIRFGVPTTTFVTVNVFNMLGQHMVTIFEGDVTGGTYEIPFDASILSSGVYLYRIQAGETVTTKRMILIK
jgi:hypothetical protein